MGAEGLDSCGKKMRIKNSPCRPSKDGHLVMATFPLLQNLTDPKLSSK